jgi:hypothetical protein
MAAHPLWLTEWLTDMVTLEPDMLVLDWAAARRSRPSSWPASSGWRCGPSICGTGADENLRRIADAGLSDRVYPFHADARHLPFPEESFGRRVSASTRSISSATGRSSISTTCAFCARGWHLAFASAGLMKDTQGRRRRHLIWSGYGRGITWTLHTADWWRDPREQEPGCSR